LAAVSVTVLTLAVIGVVLLSSTPLGCGPAKALHIKLTPNRCANVASTTSNPSPFPSFIPSPSPFPAQSAGPFPEPASNPLPPPSSSSPFPDNSSGVFPPFAPPASGSGGPGLTLNCRLPIFAGGPGSGGFITFPNGAFIADPRSAVSVPSPSPAASPSPQLGYGYQGWYGTTYDQAYSKWLPVPYRWVSPDGTRYAYPGQPDGIYVQNVANGTQIEVGEGKSWQVLDVDGAAVYAITGATGGLWRLPFSGTVTQITSSGYWQALGPNGFAYGTATSSVPNGVGNTILRLNLATGATAEFFSAGARQSSVAGFDSAGNPIIYVQAQQGILIWIGLGNNRANPIADLSFTNFYPNGSPISDRHGIWLAGGSGIALYVQGAGWYMMTGVGGQLAGGCS
jgi:hypothetical protein